jgi:hypothetical protein
MPAQNHSKKPAENRPSTSKRVKKAWPRIEGQSLKQWARMGSCSAETKPLVADWLYNKRISTSKPAQGIGRTNRVGKGKK